MPQNMWPAHPSPPRSKLVLRVEPTADRLAARTPDAQAPGGISRSHDARRGTGDDSVDVLNSTEPDESLAQSLVPLVALARQGDRGAWSTLYDLYAPVVHAVLLVRVGHPDADDLTQDVFVSAMRSITSLRDDDRFAAWLFSIARRRAGTLFRIRSMIRRSIARAAAMPTLARPPEHSDGAVTPSELLAAIRSLPEAYRETLALRLIEQLAGPDIARRLGLTHGSVRVNLTRGMKLLRDRLAPGTTEYTP